MSQPNQYLWCYFCNRFYIMLKFKTMKNLIFVAFLVMAFISAHAQETEKKSKKQLKQEKEAQQIAEVKSMMDEKSFVFEARNANPMKGRSITLTSQYDVKVTQDSVFSYLPYYGVAYNATYGGTESPMVFNSPAEKYSSESSKKGYTVKITARNGNDRLDFTFHISENGSTTLNVSSMNRQSISYYGELVKETK